MNILIIDDNEGILDAFQAMLESEGHKVTISQNAKVIKNFSDGQYPDLIFLDILLSGEDGRKICKILKRQNGTKKIPVIIMSAAMDMEESAKEANADGFLKKPFEMNEVLDAIRQFA